MRWSAGTVVALLALGTASLPAAAGEVFVCPDGKSVTVDRARRAQQYETPCAKAWFGERTSPPTKAHAKPEERDDRIVYTRAGRRR